MFPELRQVMKGRDADRPTASACVALRVLRYPQGHTCKTLRRFSAALPVSHIPELGVPGSWVVADQCLDLADDVLAGDEGDLGEVLDLDVVGLDGELRPLG